MQFMTDVALGILPARPAAVRVVRLAEVAVGRLAVVRRLTLPRAIARRLLELGLLPGTQVRVVRRAPLGDPIELRLRNYSLSIRRHEAALIEVDIVP